MGKLVRSRKRQGTQKRSRTRAAEDMAEPVVVINQQDVVEDTIPIHMVIVHTIMQTVRPLVLRTITRQHLLR